MELTQLVFNVDTKALLEAKQALNALTGSMEQLAAAEDKEARAAINNSKVKEAEARAIQASNEAKLAGTNAAKAALELKKKEIQSSESYIESKKKEKQADKDAAAEKSKNAKKAVDDRKLEEQQAYQEWMNLLEKEKAAHKALQEAKKKADKDASQARRESLRQEEQDRKELERATERQAREAQRLTDAQTSAEEKRLSILQRQQAIYDYMSQGFTRGQAGILATAQAAGVAADEMGRLMKVLNDQKKISGSDPFDKSMSALTALTNKYRELQEVIKQNQKGTGLSSSQAIEWAREKERIQARMKGQGADELAVIKETAKQELAYRKLANVYNDLERQSKSHDRSLRDKEQALRNVQSAEERLFSTVSHLNDATSNNASLNERAALALGSYERNLRLAGIAGDEAARKIQAFKDAQMQVTKAESAHRAQYVARGVGVQMGDVAVSLASGQNPLIVAIQQGDQIRSMIQMAGVQGDELRKIMNTAALSIISSFKDVGVAIGSFLVGTITTAGKKLVDFSMSLSGLKAALSSIEQLAIKLSDKGIISIKAEERIFDFIHTLKTSPVVFGAVGAAMTAMVSTVGLMTIAMFQAAKSSDVLNVSLNTLGARLGIGLKEAESFANAANGYGTSAKNLKLFIGELAAEGFKTKDALGVVAESAQKYSQVTGIALKDIAKLYGDLSKDPIDALTKLGVANGNVSASTIQMVQGLVDAGRKSEATALAIRAAADSQMKSANDIEGSLSNLAKAWINTKEGASSFWDVIVDMANTDIASGFLSKIGDGLKGIALSANAAKMNVATLKDVMSGKVGFMDYIKGNYLDQAQQQYIWENANAKLPTTPTDAAAKEKQAKANDLTGDIRKDSEQSRTAFERYKIAMARFNAQEEQARQVYTDSETLNKALADIAANRAFAMEQYNKSLPKEPSQAGYRNTLIDNQLNALKRQADFEKEIYDNRLKTLDMFNKKGKLSIADYYDAQQTALDEFTRSQLSIKEQQLGAIETAYSAKGVTKEEQARLKGIAGAVVDEYYKLQTTSKQATDAMSFNMQEAELAYSKSTQNISADLLELNNKLLESATIRNKIKFDEMRKAPTENQDFGTVGQLNQMEAIANQKAVLEQLKYDLGLVAADLTRQKQAVDYDVAKGLMSERDATVSLNKARMKAYDSSMLLVDAYDSLYNRDYAQLTQEQASAVKVLDPIFRDAASSVKNYAKEIEHPFQKLFNGMQSDLSNWFTTFEGGLKGLAQSFARTMQKMAADALAADIMRGVRNMIPASSDFSGGLLPMLFNAGVSYFTGGTSSGAGGYGATASTWSSDMPMQNVWSSYDGGGFTGNGTRSGGMDGKGGFPAILHPNESVIDHTKGQSVGGNVVINNYGSNSVDTSYDNGTLIVTIREEIAKTVPSLVSGQISNTNSPISKALANNTNTRRNRS